MSRENIVAKTLLTPSLNMKPGGREEAKEGDNGSPVSQPTQLQNPGHAAQLFGIGIVWDWDCNNCLGLGSSEEFSDDTEPD